MVIYDLVCQSGHEFEGWFKKPEDLVSQQESGILTCPYCNSVSISKKVTASKVTKKSNSSQGIVNGLQSVATNVEGSVGANHNSDSAVDFSDGGNVSKEHFVKLQKMLTKVHDYVDKNFEDVGNRFAEEALKIHKGESEATNIRGTASHSEMKELADEGVTAVPLPVKPITKKDLN